MAALLTALLALLAHFTPGAGDVLAFNPGSLWPGLHRLYTCHLTHFNASHLFWNLLVFAPFAFLAERKAPRRFRLALFVGAPLIPLFSLAAEGGFIQYRGLSGLASLAAVFFAGVMVRGEGPKAPWALLILLAFAKPLAELLLGAPLFTSAEGFRNLPSAHLSGALFGLLFSLPEKGWKNRTAW